MVSEAWVVFLDFDGVLNSNTYQLRRNSGGRLGLDPEAVLRLNRLIEDTGAEVVVSSTWRLQRTRKQLQNELDAAGFKGVVCGATTRKTTQMSDGTYARPRGLEIQEWLDNASDYGIDVESFVILDDESDMGHLSDRHIKTDLATGLLDEHVNQAIEMLHAEQPLLILPGKST